MNDALLYRGVSDAARYVDKMAAEDRKSLHETSVFGIESMLREELASVWEECREPNWDGFGALAVTNDTLRNAYIFLENMPLGCPRPSIGAEPDGHLTLEWYRSPRRTLSVSITPDGQLHYAALFGPNRKYGTEAFFGDLPDTIRDLIAECRPHV